MAAITKSERWRLGELGQGVAALNEKETLNNLTCRIIISPMDSISMLQAGEISAERACSGSRTCVRIDVCQTQRVPESAGERCKALVEVPKCCKQRKCVGGSGDYRVAPMRVENCQKSSSSTDQLRAASQSAGWALCALRSAKRRGDRYTPAFPCESMFECVWMCMDVSVYVGVCIFVRSNMLATAVSNVQTHHTPHRRIETPMSRHLPSPQGLHPRPLKGELLLCGVNCCWPSFARDTLPLPSSRTTLSSFVGSNRRIRTQICW